MSLARLCSLFLWQKAFLRTNCGSNTNGTVSLTSNFKYLGYYCAGTSFFKYKINNLWFDNCQSHSQFVQHPCSTVSLLDAITVPQKKDIKQERQNRKDWWIRLLCQFISQALWTTNQNCISATDKWYLQQTSHWKGRERAREWWITPKWEGGERTTVLSEHANIWGHLWEHCGNGSSGNQDTALPVQATQHLPPFTAPLKSNNDKTTTVFVSCGIHWVISQQRFTPLMYSCSDGGDELM